MDAWPRACRSLLPAESRQHAYSIIRLSKSISSKSDVGVGWSGETRGSAGVFGSGGASSKRLGSLLRDDSRTALAVGRPPAFLGSGGEVGGVGADATGVAAMGFLSGTTVVFAGAVFAGVAAGADGSDTSRGTVALASGASGDEGGAFGDEGGAFGVAGGVATVATGFGETESSRTKSISSAKSATGIPCSGGNAVDLATGS